MSLRLRLAILFALVALVTGAAVAATTPTIVGRGFQQLQGEPGATPGPGRGPGGSLAGTHAMEVQQETTRTVILVAAMAAAAASLLGLFLARRIVRPLDELGEAAAAVARGDLARRSGLGDRSDEIGSLGRSFDAMAADLQGAEAARRRFFQDAAHELRTPLAVITATTNAVLDGVYEHDDRHLETIRDQARLLARLVDDLRTIGLAEAGTLPLALERVDVAGLAGEVERAFAVRAGAAGVQLRLDVAPGTAVRADPDRLRQVLGALLDNALRVTPTGGSITIQAAPSGPQVRVAVQDTGPGIPAEHLSHLFERFYQADPARDRSRATSGLGLAIVRALVEAHGGKVGAEIVATGGARFWFEVPSAVGQMAAEPD